MEKIVNNDGYLRSELMDIARQLLNVCGGTGVSNIQIVTSPWKEGKGITLLAKADGNIVALKRKCVNSSAEV